MTLAHKASWHKENFARKYPMLQARQTTIRAIRTFFDTQGFDEVTTPILQTAPGCEVHLQGFSTQLLSPDLQTSQTAWLHTSPEFAMKKLIVAGVQKLYQICPVFRNAEGAGTHSPEFTMIEWYRVGCDYTQIMQDCVELVQACAAKVGKQVLSWRGKECDVFAPWQYLTVHEAFMRYANIDLASCLGNRDALAKAAQHTAARVLESDSWDDIYFSVLNDVIEPFLGVGQPTFLYEYPAHMAVLSRKKASDPRWAERFELYIDGLELANAFSELTDVNEQRIRFEADMAEKLAIYGHTWPIDEDFLQAMGAGMPECAGIALGVDRLCMLMAGADVIEDVLWASVKV